MSSTGNIVAEIGGKDEGRGRGVAGWIAVVAIALVIAVAASRLVLWALNEQVAFDGAMNLEAARSLVEGQGYRRMYGDRAAFPHEIQTRAPYILPAAVVFAAFGVGLWQAQLVNLLYLCALAWIAFVLVRRWASWRWGLLAAALCLATPGIEDWGMNGYGEVPALVWWLLALAALYRADGVPAGPLRCFAAGALVGIAIVTKTVLAIGLVAVVPILVLERVWQRRRAPDILAAVAALVVGAALPFLLHEAWRCVAIGGWESWKIWLTEEWRSIQHQAGVRAGFDDTPGLATKWVQHFGTLAAAIGVPAGLLAIWLVTPMLALAGLRRRLAQWPARPLLLTLALFAAIYFCWWLGITPTQKAWYRRVFNGVVAFELLVVLLAALTWNMRARLAVVPARIAAVAALTVFAAQAAMIWSGLADAANWATAESRDLFEQDLAALRALPPDAPLYGIGWFSVPNASLYSGRHLDDINAKTPAELAQRTPIFLLADPPTLTSAAERYWLQRFRSWQVADTRDLRIFELATDHVRDPFAETNVDPAAVRGYVDLKLGDYPYTFGFHDREGEGWSWVRPDSEVLLRYSGEAEFVLEVYMAERAQYRRDAPVSVEVRIGECRLGLLRQDESVRKQWRFPMSHCPQQAGEIVRVRLLADNVLDDTEDRQMSVVLSAVGFASAPAPAPHP